MEPQTKLKHEENADARAECATLITRGLAGERSRHTGSPGRAQLGRAGGAVAAR